MDDQWRKELEAECAVFGRLGPLEGLLHFGRAEDEYAALVGDAAIANFGDWTRIAITGKDRTTFLHNMCTNEVRKLAAGAGCEAFFLNAKGHLVAQCFVFAEPDAHQLFGAPGQTEKLLAQLQRYIIREEVKLSDRTNRCGQFLVAGPESANLLKRLTGADPPRDCLTGCNVLIEGSPVTLHAIHITGPAGYLVTCAAADRLAVWKAIGNCGARPCGLQAIETARVEYGFPIYGRDLNEQNLPQEANRDDRAINFVKGCYIGQETVARIDALGHVNRKLVGVRFAQECPPPPGTRLSAAGQPAGEITSAVFSPRLAAALALAFVRRGHDEPGMSLDSDVGKAEVVRLPV